MFWGEDKDDRVFHAGVKKLCIRTFRDGFLDLETVQDYLQNGAKQVGNVTAEEVQFVTSVVDGELVTERVLRQGAQTGTTVAGAVGSSSAGSAGRAMTEREMKQVREKKQRMQEVMETGSLLNSIKIVNPQGEEISKNVVHPVQHYEVGQKDVAVQENTNTLESASPEDVDDTVVEEIYAGMSSSDIDAIVQDCETQKARGNEAFAAGEYAQAVLLYTLTLDRASELPDANLDPKTCQKQLFPRHVVLSNRSASFLKLGHHDKALKDASEAAELEPSYVKAVFRKGLALHAMGNYEDAITALAAALKMEPKNKQIKQALQFAEVRMHQELRKRMDH
jgi:tetratricopeptide (TPR) repeat protein